MKNWVAINGKFTEENDKIVFHGGIIEQADETSNTINSQAKCGIILFDDLLSNGEIEVTVRFDSLDTYDEAQIVFNFEDRSNFMCVGITNGIAKYEHKSFNSKWDLIKLSGFDVELLQKDYNLKVCIVGSTISLFVNGIKIFSSTSNLPIAKTNVGMWVRSKSKIMISNFRTDSQKPSAFIVSQFGEKYDILYKDVIRPICEENGYMPLRGDEMPTNTAILDDIIKSIKDCAVIIAEITPDNPNVFYEIGYAHALNKPTILLCEKTCRSKLPFDLSGFRTIFYDNSIGGKNLIESQLQKHLQALNSSAVR